MGGLQEAHTGSSGIAGKLSNSLLVDSSRIPYTQINGRKQQTASCNKILFLIVPLLVVLGISAVLLLVVIQEEYFIEYYENNKQEGQLGSQKLQWNELIFTQLWGYSSCMQFKDKHFPKDVTCRYGEDPAYWSIHGIWPTREGTEGPNFCTKVKFNITLLSPIRSSLDEYWYEIDNTKQGDYFWSHEWIKHGSCAKELDTFGTELKYFSAALGLRKKFDLYDYSVLKNGNVVPESVQSGSGYKLAQMTDAITTSYGPSAQPYIQCLGKKDASTNEMSYYLLAVELCFDKDLHFIPCKEKKHLTASKFGDSALPCPSNAPIHYVDATL